jgi:hypothetical protein
MKPNLEAPAAILAFLFGTAACLGAMFWYFARSGELSVECTKAGGEWFGEACRKAKP